MRALGLGLSLDSRASVRYVTADENTYAMLQVAGHAVLARSAVWKGHDRDWTVKLLMMLAALASGSLPAAVQAQDARVERGHAFTQAHCAQCHAVGREGESPFPAAPPLRTLHRRYPVESLAESFAEGIATGHPAMPQFKLSVAQIGDLIAYLRSLE